MKITMITKLLTLIAAALVVSSCGGGGNSAASGGTTSTQPTTAIVKLATTGTLPPNTQIGAIDVTFHLPAGVTVKSTSNPPETDADVVTASGVAASNSLLVATYTASSGTARIMLANSNGVGTGEFATVNCDIAPDIHPTQTDFIVSDMIIKDINGSTISGMTASFAATIQ